jgi:hypothetical protein
MASCVMNFNQENSKDTYRTIITRRRGTEVLLAASGPGWSLPRLEISSGQRLAEKLTEGISKNWGLHTYCLFIPNFVATAENACKPKYALMESFTQNEKAHAGAYWMSFTAAIEGAALPGDECAAVKSSLQEMARYVAQPRSGPFARPGWIRELFDWVRDQIGPLGLRVTGGFQQFNASPSFSLIRIETTGPAVWFKATGEPNIHELPVTVALAHLFPCYLPRLLAIHAPWNGWLLREAPGSTLDNLMEPSAWTKTAETLAELQIASIGKGTELLERGCKDFRLGQLTEQIDPFLSCMTKLMAAQKKQPPTILTNSDIEFLGDELKKACLVLRGLGLPDTLGHIDFNPGNILVSPDGCVFLDWAEGCVGNPLITFEYFREYSNRHFIEDAELTHKIALAYLRPWQSLLRATDMTRGMALSPLIAVFGYAVSSHTWRTSEFLEHPAVAGSFRSLTRRMHREAVRITERSKLCTN